MRDGINVSSSQYEARTVSLRLRLVRSTWDLAASQLQTLARELDRTDNYLMVQLTGATKPVFFRLFRSDFADLAPADGQVGVFEGVVDLLAEPHAVGLRETQGPFTVNRDPANGTNGCYFDLGTVYGDVAAPLEISWPKDTTQRRAIVLARRTGTTAAPLVLQAENMTAGTDTALASSASYRSGGGANEGMTVSFATVATMAQRVSIAAFPTSPSVTARGTYRVFLGYDTFHSGALSTIFDVQLGYTSTDAVNSEVRLSGTSADNAVSKFIDLGLLSIPFGDDPGGSTQVEGIPISLRAERVSGSGTLTFDYLLFVPADEQMLILTEQYQDATTGNYWLNSDTGDAYALTTGGAVHSQTIRTSRTGSDGIWAQPGTSNRVCAAWALPDSPRTADLSSSIAFTLGYYPRYLHVRPAAS